MSIHLLFSVLAANQVGANVCTDTNDYDNNHSKITRELMFLVPPHVSYLPPHGASERKELLGFGDPWRLKEGVEITDKKTNKGGIIHSLYDLQIGVKYITDVPDVLVQRTTENRITVWRKKPKHDKHHLLEPPIRKSSSAIPVKEQPHSAPESIPRSNPIKIPEWSNSYKKPNYIESSADSVSPSLASQSCDSVSFGSIPRGGDILTASYGHSFEADGFTIMKSLPRSLMERSVSESSFSSNVSDPIVQIEVEIQHPHIPKEKIEKVVDDLILVRPNGKNMKGTLYMSNYQIIFLPQYSSHNFLSDNIRFMRAEFSLPLATIARFEKVDRQNSSVFSFGGENFYALDIFAKDFRRPIRFLMDPNNTKHQRKEICDYLNTHVYPQRLEDVFAVSSSVRDGEDRLAIGWFGVGKEGNKWKFCYDNNKYQLCDTYPKIIVVPSQATEDMLKEVANFRSKGRIPALTWMNSETGASLTRCSQPKTGISRSYHCSADGDLIKNIQAANSVSQRLHIMDARPMANALANMALGGGYENISYYPNCELTFMGVANIHVVRDSWNKLRELCDAASLHHLDAETDVANKGNANGNSTNANWLSQLEGTRWLDHLSSIIGGSLKIVQILDQRSESVLVHCSDGWDRTSQVCSLVQVMIDGYYRTTRGFCILIEKTWLQFGHKFGERLGLNFDAPAGRDGERSPIFFQFIDATWQVMQQFPASFQFTEELLVVILEHSYSGRFGTFLLDSIKQREENRVAELSPSLWAFILQDAEKYKNPFYNAHTSPAVLYPNSDVSSMLLWKSYYFRYLIDAELLSQYDNKFIEIGRELQEEMKGIKTERDLLKEKVEELERKMREMEKNRPNGTTGKDGNLTGTSPFNGTSIGFNAPTQAKNSKPVNLQPASLIVEEDWMKGDRQRAESTRVMAHEYPLQITADYYSNGGQNGS
ncbi:myotubularin-related protein 2-like [Planoprotostelium fungivorum]|uniref:Myotubularin-related protein 2-like n=1 Tax=Planoprotostelium fungivorum TaxID=1890364 RepID=A0A2P6NAF5_9EUKA|nr:myotubularin-related protein 2-like [Planoprotostelium fungivorum]